MASDLDLLTQELIAAITRRRGSGAPHPARDVAAEAVAQAHRWEIERALVAGDPYLDELGVPAALITAGIEVVSWPAGREQGWRELLGLEGPLRTMGVTVPSLGVAQRGTLVLETGPTHGRAIDVVSMFHLSILAASRIRWSLEEALVETYAHGRRRPSAVSLVSGPSRTSDIEKISTLGAHGALAVHVLVVEDA